MAGTTGHGDRLTRVSRGIRQCEGAWLGQRNRLIGKVRLDTATGILCRFHLRLKTSVNLFYGNTAKVSRSIRAIGEYNISGTYYWDNETQV